MAKLDKISVIVPIYNAEKYLTKCLESIINQTYKELEIILIDDGSIDNSLKICREYQKKDSRIIVISQNNSGAYKARKRAIEMASGRYVAFVDGDDWIEPDMYYDLIEIMKKNSTSMVESGIIDVNGDNEKIRIQKIGIGHYQKDRFINEIMPYMLYDGNFFESLISPTLWNKLFLKNAVKNIYDSIEDGGKMSNDAVIVYPYLVENNDIYVTNKCYYHYRVVSNSITRNKYDNILCKLNTHIEAIKMYFEKSKYKNILMPQLYMHKLRVYAMYCPEIFDSVSDEFLSVYGGINNKEKIVIYGAGKSGIKAYAYIVKHFKDNIIAWVDKNYEFLSKEFGVNIQNPQDVDYNIADKVIITVLKADAVMSIKKELIEIGVDESKISWIPYKYINNPKSILDKVDRMWNESHNCSLLYRVDAMKK